MSICLPHKDIQMNITDRGRGFYQTSASILGGYSIIHPNPRCYNDGKQVTLSIDGLDLRGIYRRDSRSFIRQKLSMLKECWKTG